jgi:hypothetical protein
MGIDKKAFVHANHIYHIFGHGVKATRQPSEAKRLILHQINVFPKLFLTFPHFFKVLQFKSRSIRVSSKTGNDEFIEITPKPILSAPIRCLPQVTDTLERYLSDESSFLFGPFLV